MPNPSDDSDKPEFSLELLEKMLPKEFSGNPKDLNNFIADCNNAFSAAHPTQHRGLLFLIIPRITGRAKSQLISHAFASWEELKNQLKALFQETKHYTQVIEDLINLKQKQGETVTDYYNRIIIQIAEGSKAAREKTPDDTTLKGKIEFINETAFSRFVYHSLPGISRFLRYRGFADLKTAYAAALDEERALQIYTENNKKDNGKKEKFCKICKKSNHDTNECYRKNGQSFSPRETRDFPRGNFEKDFRPSTSEKFCNYCKRDGHVISECRRREYANRRGQENNKNFVKTPSNAEPAQQPLNLLQPPIANPEPEVLRDVQVYIPEQ